MDVRSAQQLPSWGQVEEAIERFEMAWHADAEPDIEAFVSKWDRQVRTAGLVELIKVDLEYRTKLGRPARVEQYLDQFPELRSESNVVVELIESECLARAYFGSAPQQDELKERFGNLADEIDLETIQTEAAVNRETSSGEETTIAVDDTEAARRNTPPVFLPQLSGQTFGRYEIREQLGDGGEANVYRALDMRLQRDVALKFPRYSDANVIDRFTREPEVASAVEDRHICRIYDAGTISGVHFIAMQFVAGRSLQEVIEQDGCFEPRDAAEILSKSTAALAKVHRAGVIHRDIKPSNIMIDEDSEPVLMDFGLAKPVESVTGLTTTGEFVGTIAYMAPEQARGEPADSRSDIYSLGVVLYQMLTGTVPFSESPTDCIIQKQKLPVPAPVDSRPDLDAEIDGICRKAMAIAPKERYQMAEELSDALNRYAEGRPQAIALPPRQSRVRAWFTIVAIIALLVLGAMTVIYGGRRQLVGGFPEIPEPPAGSVDRWIETPRADGSIDQGIIAIRPASDGKRLFVAHAQDTGSEIGSPIRAIDFRTGEDLMPPISFSRFHIHNDIELSADEQRLYVPNYYFSYITQIDLANDNHKLNVPIVDSATSDSWWDRKLALTPDGKTLVVQMGADGRLSEEGSKKDDGVAIVDVAGADPRLVKRIPLPDEPCSEDAAISSDSRWAYLVTAPHPPNRSPRLYRVELRPPYALASVPFPDDSSLTSVVLSEQLAKLFVCDSEQRKIWVLDVDGFPDTGPQEYFHLNRRAPTVLLLDESPGLLIALSRDSRILYFLDAHDGRIIAQIKGLRRGSRRMALTADRQHVLVGGGSPQGGIAVIKVPNAHPPIIFTSDRGGETSQLYTMNTDGSGIRPFFRQSRIATDQTPCWSPDGLRIAFISNEKGSWHICTADRDGNNVRVFDDTHPDIAEPIDWSPDGRQVAFAHKDRRAIHVVDTETGAVTIAADDFPDPYDWPTGLCWAPDGYIIASVMRSSWGPDCDLFRIDPTSHAVEQLTDELGKEQHCQKPIVSPDGRLACIRKLIRDDPNPRLFLAPEKYQFEGEVQPREWKAVTTHESVRGHQCARWFPDGRRIAYADLSPDSLFQRISIVDSQTGEVTQLTTGDWNDTQPDVNPTSSEHD
ncbi:protein kinase [Aeoliella sp. ICT_H6.2]|uniref:non-specific serine/threonine protein kinase n=1 Tax=Aeoliella straminimaris TaxID=2954799 RepID=A0A9X2F6T5_9BACT|nr:protein kinase [Aeoliella straminimaris]MCO6043305.1 protein kinase [Aeoliella straminimaris]